MLVDDGEYSNIAYKYKIMKIKILHLSDLHIKNSSTPQDLVLTSLTKKIQELAKAEPIKILIVTGDIAYSGKTS